METKGAIQSVQSKVSRLKYVIITLNVLLLISFFLPWIKTTGELSMVLDSLSLGSVDGYVRVSPFRMIDLVSRLASYFGPGYGSYQGVYVFLIIPIAAIANIITYFFKQEKSKLVQLITSGLVLLLVIYVFMKVESIEDIGYFIKANIGFYLALLSSLGIIITQFIKEDSGLVKKAEIDVNNQTRNKVDFGEVGDSSFEKSPEENNQNEKTTEEESSFKKNKDQFVNFLKDDYSNKDKLHKSLIIYGGIILITLIIGIIFEAKYDYSIITPIVSSIVLFLLFAFSYFRMDFKFTKERNEQIIVFSDSLSNITDFLSSYDKSIFMIAIVLFVLKFFTSYTISTYEFTQMMIVINMIINTLIIIVLLRLFAIKDFKGLRNSFIVIGAMYFIMILRKGGYNYYWIDYKSIYMLWMAWIGFLIIETNFKIEK